MFFTIAAIKATSPCNRTIHAEPFKSNTLSLSTNSSPHEPMYCVLWIVYLEQSCHIDLHFNRTDIGAKDPNGCSSYVHIGNDVNRVNQPSLTSYKFCAGQVLPAIVSRGHVMWIAFMINTTRSTWFPWQQLSYSVLPRGRFRLYGI